MRVPDIIGVEFVGQRQAGITATDIVLALTEFLRQERVVGAYLEFFGEGADSMSVGDRATISNMTPEYGATAAMFYIDQNTLDYLTLTGREAEQIKLVETYAKEIGLWAAQMKDAQYPRILHFDLSTVTRNIAGPSNPHARINSRFKSQRYCWRGGTAHRWFNARWCHYYCCDYLMYQYF